MRILFCTTSLPSLRHSGSEVASQNFIDSLRYIGHQVVVLGYLWKNKHTQLNLDEIPVSTIDIQTNKSSIFIKIKWLLTAVLFDLGVSEAKYYTQKYREKVNSTLDQDGPFDAIVIDHLQLSWLIEACGKSQKNILICHNIESGMYKKMAEAENSFIKKLLMKRESLILSIREKRLSLKFDQAWCLTQDDQQYFAKLGFGENSIHCPLSSGLAYKEFSPPPASIKNRIVGVLGMWSWLPNYQGLEWFLSHVIPLVPSDITFFVGGSGGDRLCHNNSRIKYVGFVPDLSTFFSAVKCIAIPSIAGGGIQVKTLDALMYGKPVVATSTAIRGIHNVPANVHVADTPIAFSQALISAINSNENISGDWGLCWNMQRRKLFEQTLEKSLSLP